MTWSVVTRVVRLSAPGQAAVLEVPLLDGEAVATEGVAVEGGKARVAFAPDASEMNWSSTLEPRETIALRAPASVAWVEDWQLEVAPIWHVDAEGIPPVAVPETDPAPLRAWRPWPGEMLTLSARRPLGVGGATLTHRPRAPRSVARLAQSRRDARDRAAQHAGRAPHRHAARRRRAAHRAHRRHRTAAARRRSRGVAADPAGCADGAARVAQQRRDLVAHRDARCRARRARSESVDAGRGAGESLGARGVGAATRPGCAVLERAVRAGAGVARARAAARCSAALPSLVPAGSRAHAGAGVDERRRRRLAIRIGVASRARRETRRARLRRRADCARRSRRPSRSLCSSRRSVTDCSGRPRCRSRATARPPTTCSGTRIAATAVCRRRVCSRCRSGCIALRCCSGRCGSREPCCVGCAGVGTALRTAASGASPRRRSAAAPTAPS